MTNKMTNKVALEIAIEAVKATGNTEAVEKLEKMLIQVEKKNSVDRKPTATQTENVSLKEAILLFMENGKQYTVTEIMKGCGELEGLSNQKVSALMKQLYEGGKVTKEIVKRKSYFSLVEEA